MMRLSILYLILLPLFMICRENSPVKPVEEENVPKTNDTIHGYTPKQPIPFSHSVHTSITGIDCKYCHDSEAKAKQLSMKDKCIVCHQKDGKTLTALPDSIIERNGGIVWKKVHNLPDSVYFNHKQHVIVSLSESDPKQYKYYQEIHERLLKHDSRKFSNDCSKCQY